MKTTNVQTFAQKAIEGFISTKSNGKFRTENYQAYEDYEDHIDSFVLKHTNERDNLLCSPKPLHIEFAKQMILRRIKDKQQEIVTNAYGESLYGDHVDSPSYDDYLDCNCGDNE